MTDYDKLWKKEKVKYPSSSIYTPLQTKRCLLHSLPDQLDQFQRKTNR